MNKIIKPEAIRENKDNFDLMFPNTNFLLINDVRISEQIQKHVINLKHKLKLFRCLTNLKKQNWIVFYEISRMLQLKHSSESIQLE